MLVEDGEFPSVTVDDVLEFNGGISFASSTVIIQSPRFLLEVFLPNKYQDWDWTCYFKNLFTWWCHSTMSFFIPWMNNNTLVELTPTNTKLNKFSKFFWWIIRQKFRQRRVSAKFRRFSYRKIRSLILRRTVFLALYVKLYQV